MASYAFRKVSCIDPCDPNGIMTRQLALLVQTELVPRHMKTNMSIPISWKPEPILVNPVRMVDKIAEDTVIQNIHVIDPVFGNQTVQYIINLEPIVRFNASNDKKAIAALWPQAIQTPGYAPGQARAAPPYRPGEVKMDGARSDFAASYNDKYRVKEDVLADDVPTYCNCLIKGDDGSDRQMIQCSNEERYCLKEWYHIDCIGMAEEDVPPGDVDWFCNECVLGRLGKLKAINYVPYKSEKQRKGRGLHLPFKEEDKKVEQLKAAGVPAAAEKAQKATEKRGAAFINYGYEIVMRPAPSRTTVQRKLSLAQLTPGLGEVAEGLQIQTSCVLPIDFRTPIDTQPYSAELDKQFILSNHASDFNLTTLDEARTSLLQPTHTNDIPTQRTPKKGKWSADEEDALVEVVRECVSDGLAGEPMWEAAHPKLQARGIDRTIAAMKMVWCRGLRERSNIDERRNKDSENMKTAIQDGVRRPRGKKERKTKTATELGKCAMQFRDAMLLSGATSRPVLGRKRAASV